MNNDLVLINSVAHKNYSVDEVYTFSVVLCDNDIDRDLEYFTSDTLEELSKMFVGVTGIFDHNPTAKNQVARIYSCGVENLSPQKTAYGADYVRLTAKAYLPVCESNKDLIAMLDSGIKKEVSVGCGIDECSCSICGKDMRISECKHKKGKIYNGKICCGVLKSPMDVYEWSFVFKNQDETDEKTKTVRKPKKAKWQRIAMDKICKEYLSKCKCCDECFAVWYCTGNRLRSSREPQDYCLDNLKAYLKEASKELIEYEQRFS